MRSSLSCARTKRWWLFAAESIRWPTISFADHFPSSRLRDACSSLIESRRDAASSTVRVKSCSTSSIGRSPFLALRGRALLVLLKLAGRGEDEAAAHDDLAPDRASPPEARRVRRPVEGGELVGEVEVAEVVALDLYLLLPALARPLGGDDEGRLVAVQVVVLVAHAEADARRLGPLPVHLPRGRRRHARRQRQKKQNRARPLHPSLVLACLGVGYGIAFET